MRTKRITVIFGIALLIMALLGMNPSARIVDAQDTSTGTTERVSVATDGREGNDDSWYVSISADGRYAAFESYASNLINSDTNGYSDIFVRDRQTGETTRVSVATGGVQGDGASYNPSISADGRYVAFESTSSNLVTDDIYWSMDIFVHDRQTGETELISSSLSGGVDGEHSYSPSISADGRYVAFESIAPLASGDTNGYSDIFVRDRQTDTTTRVSIASDGSQGYAESVDPSISAEGRYVTFESYANNLVNGDTNGTEDVFVHDRQTGTTTRVSITTDGAEVSNSGPMHPVISADGRYVSFSSYAVLVSGDTNSAWDIFVHDRQTGETTRISVATGGTQANYGAGSISSISADGRYVAFMSEATNLVSGDYQMDYDVFVRDRLTAETTRVSLDSCGVKGNHHSELPSISADGRYIAFMSYATNLVSGDTNDHMDIFVRDRQGTSPCYFISGAVRDGEGNPISDVQIQNEFEDQTFTDSDGIYVLSSLEANTHTITPYKDGYTFTPESRTVTVPPSQVDQDFVGTPITPSGYSISGKVLSAPGVGLSGVEVILTLQGEEIQRTLPTNNSGNFAFVNVDSGDYTIYASRLGYYFRPAYKDVTLQGENIIGQNFSGFTLATQPIILLPGILGSKLKNTPSSNCILRPSGEVWPAAILSNLAAPLSTLNLRADGVTAANACDHISAFSLLYENPMEGKDLYWDFIQEISKTQRVELFPYDWRLDISGNANLLDDFISKKSLNDPILIGHSMGGLIARQYVSDPYRANKISAVITVATPYWGAPKAAYQMRNGLFGALDKNLKLPDMVDNLKNIAKNSPGSMQLLPSRSYFQQAAPSGYYYDGGELLPDYNTTRDFFIEQGQNATLISRAQEFHYGIDSLDPTLLGRDPANYVPYFILVGNHRPTIGTVNEKQIRTLSTEKVTISFETTNYLSGDDTVPWRSARLSGVSGNWAGNASVCTVRDLIEGHGALMHDGQIREVIQSILGGIDWTSDCSNLSAGVSKFYLASDADPNLSLIHIYFTGDAKFDISDPQNNHIGLHGDGYINTIPGATLDLFPYGANIALPYGQIYNLTILPLGNSQINLKVSVFQTPALEEPFVPIERAVFVDIPSVPGSSLTLPIDLLSGISSLQMSVDMDNDGNPDGTRLPDAILNASDSTDYSPPITSFQITGTTGDFGYYAGTVTAVLSGSDTGSGVFVTEYSLDNGNTWNVYTEPLVVEAEEVPVLMGRSVDRAGNHEYPWAAIRLNPYRIFFPLAQR